MINAKAQSILQRMDEVELKLCLRFNRACRSSLIRLFFIAVSRLGDGVFWYVLVLVLPVIYGVEALAASLHMSAVAIVGLLIYKYLKSTLVRQRPFVLHKEIRLGTAPLDRYSFPSGHTLHAVAFTILGIYYYSELAWLLVPFALMVALSRVALGLHYPT